MTTMNWNSLSEFLHMGGYGLYVWGSYAVTLGLLVIETTALIARERNSLKGLGNTCPTDSAR